MLDQLAANLVTFFMRAQIARGQCERRVRAMHWWLEIHRHPRTQLRDNRGRVPFRKQSLGRLANVDVRVAQQREQFVITLPAEVFHGEPLGCLVAHAVEPSLRPFDPRGVAVGVLIAVVLVVPVEHVEAAIRGDLLGHRHKPGIVGDEEVGFPRAEVGRPLSFDFIRIHAVAVNVPHVERAVVTLGEGRAIEPGDAAVGRLLMLVLDDRLDLPRVRRIGPRLPVVVAGLDDVPEVIDHAGREEEAAFLVDGNPPGVARSLGVNLKLTRAGIDPPQRDGQRPARMILFEVGVLGTVLHMRKIEHAVEAIQPAIGPPGEGIRQLMRVVSTKPGDDRFDRVGLEVAIGVAGKQNVRRVGDPDAAMPHRNPRGNVQPVEEHGRLVNLAIAIGVFQHLDPVAPLARLAAGILQRLRHPDAALLVDAHRHRVHQVRLARHKLDLKPLGHDHLRQRLSGRQRGSRRHVLVPRNHRIGSERGPG